jgi:DNA-binding transcriptional LysR family regulator
MSLTRALVERIRDGRLDLAIIAGQLSEPGFRAESLGYDEFVWMAGPKLKVPRKTLGPKELQRWPVLSLSEDSFHYPVIERWVRDGGAFFKAAASCNNMNVVAELTAQGLGVSLLPRHCYRAEVAGRRLVVLKTAPAIPRVEFSLIHRVDRPHPLIPPIAEMAKAASELAHR